MRHHLNKIAVVWLLGAALARADFSVATRTSYINDQEKGARAAAHVSPETWAWLKSHKEIRDGLFSVSNPTPAVYVENLDLLRSQLGNEIADKYPNLILALSVQIEPLASEIKPADDKADPDVAKVAAYLKSHDKTILDLITAGDTLLAEIDPELVKHKNKGALYNQTAIAMGTFPKRVEQTTADWAKEVIARYETKLPKFEKGPQWPLFPFNDAPWPLLLPMQQKLPKDESAFIWDHFRGAVPEDEKRLHTYGKYTWDYEKPEVKWKQSQWNPGAIPRIIEDGGVCGRLSTLAQYSYLALAKPAVGMYQPGHRALMAYAGAPGSWVADGQQSIAGVNVSTNPWFFRDETGFRIKADPWQKGTAAGFEYHMALALAMDVGVDKYIDSRIAMHLANKIPASDRSRKLAMIQSAISSNVYNLNAWYAWSDMMIDDGPGTIKLLTTIDQKLRDPTVKTLPEVKLSASTDFAKEKQPEVANSVKKSANSLADTMANLIAERSFKNLFVHEKMRGANRKLLDAEIARRDSAKTPYGADVKTIAFQYQVALEGTKDLTPKLLADMSKAFDVKKKKREKALIDSIQDRIDVSVIYAGTDVDVQVGWLQQFRDAYPEELRFVKSEKDPVKADGLYNWLYEKQKQLLAKAGKTYKDKLKKLNEDFAAELAKA